MATNFMLQTAGKMWRATFVGACRLGLVLGVVILILPPMLGMLGVQLAQPVTDIVTTLIALPIGLGAMRELEEAEAKHEAA
jgi:Na+-driven multidrug efflux pump